MNSTRHPLIAGNWKMNTSHAEALALAAAIAAESVSGVDVVVCPPFPWLLPVKATLLGSTVSIGAQDCWPAPNGAYTGGVSTQMLQGLVQYVIVGHSERRQLFGESDDLVRTKVTAVLNANLTPILCVGESLEVRNSGGADNYVTEQLNSALGGRSESEIGSCVIAYEPIWAIGTGAAASSADAEEMAVTIRFSLDALCPDVSQRVRVIYGGSVTSANCVETLGQPNVDGALVGGASLKPELFLPIVRAMAD